MKEIPLKFSSNGREIFGVLHLPNKKNAPCVVMCHGYGGNKLGNDRRTFVKAARYFAKNGLAAFRFDFFGCGDSEGDFKDQTITTQIRNLTNAITFLQNSNSVDRKKIGVMGWSRGSAICILAASKDARIRCVVSWAGEDDFRNTWANKYIREVKKRGQIYFWWWNTMITKRLLLDEKKYNIIKSARKLRIPFLVVHGTRDENITLVQGETLYKAAKMPKKILIIKNADHSFAGYDDKVIRNTFLWFKKWLK